MVLTHSTLPMVGLTGMAMVSPTLKNNHKALT